MSNWNVSFDGEGTIGSYRFKNKGGDPKINSVFIMGSYEYRHVYIYFKNPATSSEFLEGSADSFKNFVKHANNGIIQVDIPSGDLQAENASKVLEAINSFETINPISVFARMKKSVGSDLGETYFPQIHALYIGGDFDAAFALALRCREAGMSGLIHGLTQLCLEAHDYKNIMQTIGYESDPASIYDFALQIFTAVEVDGVASRREKLKMAMKLFDFCGPVNDALTLKTQIFAELAGKSFDVGLVALATDLHGDNLCKVADLLFMQHREIEKLKMVAGHGGGHASEATVMRGFSGGASGGSKSDASTQTDESGSEPK